MESKIHRSSWTRENKEDHTIETSYNMKDEIFDKIRTIIADFSQIEIEDLTSTMLIQDDMGLDKWELTEISQSIEYHFDIVIDDDDVNMDGTLGQYVDLISREISKS